MDCASPEAEAHMHHSILVVVGTRDATDRDRDRPFVANLGHRVLHMRGDDREVFSVQGYEFQQIHGYQAGH